jgi:hypothetical protein
MGIVIITHLMAIQAMQQEQQGLTLVAEQNFGRIGRVQRFSDDSIRIDNYLGQPRRILYLSPDLTRYSEVDPTGKKVLDSGDAQIISRTQDANLDEHIRYRHPDGTEVYYTTANYVVDRVPGRGLVNFYVPLLEISYPDGITVELQGPHSQRPTLAGFTVTIEGLPVDDLIDLYSAIDELDSDRVGSIIERLRRKNSAHALVNHRLYGETPLTKVIKSAINGTDQQLAKAQAIIALLMQAGADFASRDSQGNTPAKLAMSNRVLLEALSEGLLKQLLVAHQRGDAAAAKRLVAFFAPVLHAYITRFDNAQIRKLLGTISKAGNTEQLLKDLVNFQVQGDTALHTAAKRARQIANDQQFEDIKGIMQMLLGAGADPSIPNNQNKLPLELLLAEPAPGVYEVELVKLFVQASGRALFDAITRSDMRTVEKLLADMQRRGNRAQLLNTMTNDAGQTPLVYALSLARTTKNTVQKQELLYIAQYLVNAGATLDPQGRQQFQDVVQFLTGLK